MALGPVKQSKTIISACMRRDGLPTFALTKVAVTQEEADNGHHYQLVEEQLIQDGYEEPFVHFAEEECPRFLKTGVRQLLRQATHDPNLVEAR